jgi:hypothetical protein
MQGRGSSVGPYDATMDVQPLTYCGRTVVACTGECFLVADGMTAMIPSTVGGFAG